MHPSSFRILQIYEERASVSSAGSLDLQYTDDRLLRSVPISAQSMTLTIFHVARQGQAPSPRPVQSTRCSTWENAIQIPRFKLPLESQRESPRPGLLAPEVPGQADLRM